MAEINRRRHMLMRGMVPRLYDEPGTLLYVGAYTGRVAETLELYRAGNELTILEIWEPAVIELRQNLQGKRVQYVVHGDVREIDQIELPYEQYDYTVWLHGPEHVGCHEFVPTVKKLEEITLKGIILSCPWGRVPHGLVKRGILAGNIHTQHRCYLYPEDFQGVRYNLAALGPKNRAGGYLFAWKWLTD